MQALAGSRLRAGQGRMQLLSSTGGVVGFAVSLQSSLTKLFLIPYSSAVDGRSGTKVAIKKLYRPFQSELFAKRAYRELRLLKHMKHENVSWVVSRYPPKG